VPRTRPELQRDEKVAQVLEAGERRLRRDGFEALSVIGIARDLGLAQNAVYWYFPSRAELFAAVLWHMLEGIAARKPRREVEISERALWWTDQFAKLYELRPAMQEQARKSKVVAQFLSELDELLERMLTNAFRGRVADEQLTRAVASFKATVIGTYAQGLSRGRRREVLAFSLSLLLVGDTRATRRRERPTARLAARRRTP
jgi:AcrR family transcriptional regulator